MKTIQHLTQLFIAALSVVTSLGVVVHDTHLDKATTIAVGRPVLTNYSESEERTPRQPLDSMGPLGKHAHVDYNPLAHALTNAFSYQNPTIGPRRESHHKQLLAQLEQGGRHAFDNTNLPILVD